MYPQPKSPNDHIRPYSYKSVYIFIQKRWSFFWGYIYIDIYFLLRSFFSSLLHFRHRMTRFSYWFARKHNLCRAKMFFWLDIFYNTHLLKKPCKISKPKNGYSFKLHDLLFHSNSMCVDYLLHQPMESSSILNKSHRTLLVSMKD